MVRLLIAVLLLGAFVAGAALSFYNFEAVTFNYLAGTAELPLIALLLGAFVAGLAVMGALDAARRFRVRQALQRRDRQIRELESELGSLRGLPLEGARPARRDA